MAKKDEFLEKILEKLDGIGGSSMKDILMRITSDMNSERKIELLATDKVEGVFVMCREFLNGEISLFVCESSQVNLANKYYIRISRKYYPNEYYKVIKKSENKN